MPIEAHNALREAFLPAFRVATEGLIPPLDRAGIDHLCHTSDLAVVSVRGLDNRAADGRMLSDHFGLHLLMGRATGTVYGRRE
jgi:endonuclease/exonuclease/phosphatase family metal-dependent hydrolase